MREDTPQQDSLRDLLNGLRYTAKIGCDWRSFPHDLPPWHAVCQQARHWVPAGYFLALHIVPADVDERKAIGELARKVQGATGDSVELVWVDQGYTGPSPAAEAEAHGITLDVVRLPEAKKGFVPMSGRWVVEGNSGRSSRFRRLSKDYERLAETFAGA